MKLFIIGNGFDKGHGLKTGYWDFRSFLKNCYPDFLYAFESNYDIYPGDSDKYKQELLWNEFESNLANIDEGEIIENATSIDMGLESGDIGIEDTLYPYFRENFVSVEELSKYLKYWIRSIRIRDLTPRTTMIDSENNDKYLTFNYTSVLENVYKIKENQMVHIHGSLRIHDGEPIIGHGNQGRMESIREEHRKADERFDEKEASIDRVIEDYYESTFKNVSRYIHKLNSLINTKEIEEVIIIGHSVAGVDVPYFTRINYYLGDKVKWRVYYYAKDKKINICKMYRNLRRCGINREQIDLRDSIEFYDL